MSLVTLERDMDCTIHDDAKFDVVEEQDVQ